MTTLDSTVRAPAEPDASWLRRLAPLGTALIWGVNIPVMKGAVGHAHPFAFNALRLTLTVVVLAWLEQRARARGTRARATGATTRWVPIVLLSILSGFLYQVLFLSGLGLTSAGHTSVLIGSSPLWTALLARWAGMERHGRGVWIALGVAFAGTVCVVWSPSGTASLRGDLLVLGAALAWAFGAVVSRRLLDDVSPLRLAYLFALIALPFNWAVAIPTHDWSTLGSLPPAFWGAVVYSGVFSTGVAYVLWNQGLVALGPARTAVYVNLVPVIAIVLAWVTLGEHIGGVQLVGAALVIGGLASSQRLQATERT